MHDARRRMEILRSVKLTYTWVAFVLGHAASCCAGIRAAGVALRTLCVQRQRLRQRKLCLNWWPLFSAGARTARVAPPRRVA